MDKKTRMETGIALITVMGISYCAGALSIILLLGAIGIIK